MIKTKAGHVFESKKTQEEFAEIRERMADQNESAVWPTGFEDAIIGIGYTFGKDPVFVLDRDKCIDLLVRRDGMTSEDAEEHFGYNVIGTGIDHAPIFVEIVREVFTV